MTLTRHVYSPHIDVASLIWWNTLDQHTRQLLQSAMYEAALFQRQENRSKNSERLQLLKKNGFIVEENPDLEGLRQAVANLQENELYQDPRVKNMLIKILEATR